MKWDDIKIFNAVGSTGSFSGAAKKLGIDHSSVSRRMRMLENAYDVRLFERKSSNMLMTTEAQSLFEIAKKMSSEAKQFERLISNTDHQIRGCIRFATVDSTARLLMGAFREFRHLYPQITLEIITGQNLTNLTQNEADVVLRSTNTPPETYIGRRLATHHFCIFTSNKYFTEAIKQRHLADFPWVLWSDGFTDEWMEKNYPDASCVCRANSVLGMIEAIRAGIGIGHLACLSADNDPEFTRISPPNPELNVDLWLLYHQDLKRSTRIKVFIEFIANEMTQRKLLIEGQAPMNSEFGSGTYTTK